MDDKRISVSLITGDYMPVVASFYRIEDLSFFQQYHKAKGGFAECLADTCDTISEGADFFVCNMGRETVAFFVRTIHKGISVLEGFHIKKGYRVASVIAEFWEIVRGAFCDEFMIGISVDNTPACVHLERNGFEKITTAFWKGKCFTLLKNKLI